MIALDWYLTVDHVEYVIQSGNIFLPVVIDAEHSTAPAFLYLPDKYHFLSQLKFRIGLVFTARWSEIQSVHLVKQLEPHNAPDPVIWFGYYAAK